MAKVVREYSRIRAIVDYDHEQDVLYVIFHPKAKITDREPCGAEIVWGKGIVNGKETITSLTLWPAKEILADTLKNYILSYLEGYKELCELYNIKFSGSLIDYARKKIPWQNVVYNVLVKASQPIIVEGLELRVRYPYKEHKNEEYGYISWSIPLTGNWLLEAHYKLFKQGTCRCNLIRGKRKIPECIKILPHLKRYHLKELKRIYSIKKMHDYMKLLDKTLVDLSSYIQTLGKYVENKVIQADLLESTKMTLRKMVSIIIQHLQNKIDYNLTLRNISTELEFRLASGLIPLKVFSTLKNLLDSLKNMSENYRKDSLKLTSHTLNYIIDKM